MRNIHIIFLPIILLFIRCSDASENKPNVLLITADDLGTNLSCYGDTVINTTNIDRLAEDGIKLTNAYVTQASCSPSRSSIYTGLFPHQNGQVGLSHRGFSMIENLPNMVRILKNEGYRTGIIGKLHVEPADEYPFDYKKTNAQVTRDVRNVASQAEEFLKAGEGPFFLAVNYFDPHVKFMNQVNGIPEDPVNGNDVHPFDFQLVNTPGQLNRIAGYYNCIKRLDVGIGLLMDKLETLQLLENTLIIFIGDHGAPFTRSKTSCYEAGVKIPFLVRYPQLISKSKVSRALVSTIDIFPTVMDVCKIQSDAEIAGKSLAPLFTHTEDEFRDYLFTEFNFHVGIRGFFPRRAVRNDTFKLIHNLRPSMQNHIRSVDGDSAWYYAQREQFQGTLTQKLFERYENPPEFELYNLIADPHEYNNMANDPLYFDEMKKLQKALYQWRKNTNDPMLYTYFWDKFEYINSEHEHN